MPILAFMGPLDDIVIRSIEKDLELIRIPKVTINEKNKVLETYLNELMSYTTEEGKAIIHHIKEME